MINFEEGTEQSRAWNELRLYFDDLWQRLGEEHGKAFFPCLKEAAHLVDEANDITTELVSENHLKYEVELVWDIHREPADIIVIRALRAVDDGDAVVDSYMALGHFRDRVERMRECFKTYRRNGEWLGKGDPSEDPWIDPSPTELRLHMKMIEAAEIKKMEEAEEATVETSLAIASGLSGSFKPVAKRSPSGIKKSSQQNSSKQVGGERTPQAKTLRPWRSGSSVSSVHKKLPPAMERVIPGRPSASPAARQRVPGHKSGAASGQNASVKPEPQANASLARAAPEPDERVQGQGSAVVSVQHAPQQPELQSNTTSLRAAPEPDAEPTISKDAVIAALRQQLADKEKQEHIHKDKILSLSQRLASLEIQHGSLASLTSEHEQQIASPVVRHISRDSEVLASSSGLGARMIPSPHSVIIAPVRSPPAPQRRVLLSGSIATAPTVVKDANTTILAVGHSPQKVISSRSLSSTAQTSEAPFTNRSMTVPVGQPRPLGNV